MAAGSHLYRASTQSGTSLNLDRFESAARDQFAFLQRRYGFSREVEPKAERRKHAYVRTIHFRGPESFVCIAADDRDRAFDVSVGPLSGGERPPYEIFLPPRSDELMWLPLWAILRAKAAPVPSFSFVEDNRLDRELAVWAHALDEYAADGLVGNFEGLRMGAWEQMRQNLAAARADMDDVAGARPETASTPAEAPPSKIHAYFNRLLK